MGCISKPVGKQLGNFIGKFVDYDTKGNTGFWRSYIRIKVTTDFWIPLKRFKKINKEVSGLKPH